MTFVMVILEHFINFTISLADLTRQGGGRQTKCIFKNRMCEKKKNTFVYEGKRNVNVGNIYVN